MSEEDYNKPSIRDEIQNIRDLTPYGRLMILAKLLETADEDIEMVMDEINAGQRDPKDIAPLVNALINLPMKVQMKLARKLIRQELGIEDERRGT